MFEEGYYGKQRKQLYFARNPILVETMLGEEIDTLTVSGLFEIFLV